MNSPAPIVFSHSELESAQRCPFQHQLSYVERWSKPKSEDTAAGKGTLWHSVMQAHFGAIKEAQDNAHVEHGHWRAFNVETLLGESLRAVERVLSRIVDEEVRELMEWMYKGYVDYWGCDLDWEIVSVEQYAEVPLRPKVADEFEPLFGYQNSGDMFQFKMYIDLMVRESGRLWVVDHKTVHNFPRELDLDLDPQFDRYTWAMRELGHDVFGQQYNMARRQRLKTEQPLELRHKRAMTHRSDVELDSIADDMFVSIYNRYRQAAELEQLGRDAPRFASSRHCSFMCDFTNPCLMGRKGVPTRDYLGSLGFTPNTPRHTPTDERRNAT